MKRFDINVLNLFKTSRSSELIKMLTTLNTVIKSILLLESSFMTYFITIIKHVSSYRTFHVLYTQTAGTFACVRAAFFTLSWDCSNLKFFDQPSVFASLVATPKSSYRDMLSCTHIHMERRKMMLQPIK